MVDSPACPTRLEHLYELGRELLKEVWKLKPVTATLIKKIHCIGAAEDTFIENKNGGYVVHLVVTKSLNGKRWTPCHTLALEQDLKCAANIGKDAAVVVVDGDVDKEALDMNAREDALVHVIDAIVLTNADLSELPHLVDPQSVCETEGLTSATELPWVSIAAPEAQLLRAKVHDVIAYPPTPDYEKIRPSGQHFDWVARIVIR